MAPHYICASWQGVDVICLRCGCEIYAGEQRRTMKVTTRNEYEASGQVWPYHKSITFYEEVVDDSIPIHNSTDLCLVAIRRKEVEAAQQEKP